MMSKPKLLELQTDISIDHSSEITVRLPKVFLFKPIQFLNPKPEFKDFGELYSILCINCQNLIHSDLIESHSNICVNSSNFGYSFEQESTFTQSILEIQKLYSNLKDLLVDRLMKLTEKSVVVNLLRIIKPIIESHQKEQLTNAIKEIEKINKYFTGSIALGIYIARSKLLIQNTLDKLAVKPKRQKSNLIPKINIKLNFSPIRNNLIENREEAFNKNICETDPNEKKVNSYKQFANTAMTRTEKDRNGIRYTRGDSISSTMGCEEKYSPGIEGKDNVSEDKMSKHFYSLCKNLKIKYSSVKDVQFISNYILYKEIKENEVAFENWCEYLEKIFQKPSKRYLNNTIMRSSSFKTRKSFESIIEI